MALKFGRSIPKTTDPKTGARIADPEVFGRVIPEGTVSSWPKVREMYKAGVFGEEGKNANFGPEVMKYLSGEVNTLSDTEFEEPILSRIPREGGGTKPALQAFLKPGGKAYAAMEAKTKRKPVTAGKINQYSTNQYGSGNDLSVGETTDLGTFRKKLEPAQKKVEPIQAKVEPVTSVVTEDKPKPQAVVVPKKPKVKEPVVKEKEAFVTPEKNYKTVKKVSMNPLAKGATSQGSTKRYIGKVAESVGSRVKNVLKGNVNKGYMREQKLFYDTYGGGETIGKEGFGDMSLDEVRGLKKQIKADPALSKSDLKEGKIDLNSAIRLKKLESKDKVNFWTEGKGAEYRNSADYESSRAAYRSQTANATNQNNIPNQQAKLGEAPTSFFTTRGQMKDKYKEDNPTATPRQIRQGVRTEIKTNRQTQIDLRKKEQEKGMY